MAATFEFRRSTYQKGDSESDPVTESEYAAREIVTSIGASGNLFNWTSGKFEDSANPTTEQPNVIGDTADPKLFPLFPLNELWASCEVYLRGYWGGTDWTHITGVRMFAPVIDLTGYGVGAFVNGRVVDQYPTGDSTLTGGLNPNGQAGPLFIRPDFVFTAYPEGIKSSLQQSSTPDVSYLDLTPGDMVTPSDEASRYSRYAVLQLATGSNPQPGEGGQCTFKLVYDES